MKPGEVHLFNDKTVCLTFHMQIININIIV